MFSKQKLISDLRKMLREYQRIERGSYALTASPACQQEIWLMNKLIADIESGTIGDDGMNDVR